IKAMTTPPPSQSAEKRRPDGTSFGLGWDQVRRTPQGRFYCKGGSLLGVHAHIEHTPDAIAWALLWNGGRKGQTEDDGTPQQFVKDLRQALAEIEVWPEDDLFTRPADRSQ